MSGPKSRSHSGATARQLAQSDRLFLKVFRADAIAEQGRKCHYCREWIPPEAVTADHRTAKANGGTTQRKDSIPRLRAWIRFRMERQLKNTLRRIRRSVGIPE